MLTSNTTCHYSRTLIASKTRTRRKNALHISAKYMVRKKMQKGGFETAFSYIPRATTTFRNLLLTGTQPGGMIARRRIRSLGHGHPGRPRRQLLRVCSYVGFLQNLNWRISYIWDNLCNKHRIYYTQKLKLLTGSEHARRSPVVTHFYYNLRVLLCQRDYTKHEILRNNIKKVNSL